MAAYDTPAGLNGRVKSIQPFYRVSGMVIVLFSDYRDLLGSFRQKRAGGDVR